MPSHPVRRSVPARYAPAMDVEQHAPAASGSADGPETGNHAEETDWAAYYRHTLGREPRPLFTGGMDHVTAAGVVPGRAVDVGFGDGTETLSLLEAGWQVTAIDGAPAAAEVLEPRVPADARERLAIMIGPAEDVDLAPFDLVYSAYVLSYLEPVSFARLWARIRERLNPGGYVIVNIFGDRHAWAGEPGTTFLPRSGVEALLDGLETLALDETEEDGDSFIGPTHWHVFDIVARRPA